MSEGNLLARGISVIEKLSASSNISTDEVSLETGIPRSSVYRILCVLEELGYALRYRNEHRDVWSLSLKFLKLSAGILGRLDIKSAVEESLIRLADDTKEIVQLAVLDGVDVVLVNLIKRHPSAIGIAPVGIRLDVNLNASGMVLAAHAGEAKVAEIMERKGLPRRTEFTVTDPAEFRGLLARIREQGYALDDQYDAIGHRCIGAPILDHTGTVVAAMNISGHMQTITDERLPALIGMVKARALEASRRLGFE